MIKKIDKDFDSLKEKLEKRIYVCADYLYYYLSYDGESDLFNDMILRDCGADNYDHGASKIVLFYDDIKDWVVKLPYFGDYDDDVEDEEDTFPYTDFVEDRCRYYHGANENIDIDSSDNYCEAEAYIAEQAELEGLGDMFAKTYYLGTFNHVPVYVSEKIESVVYDEEQVEYSRNDSGAETHQLFQFYGNEFEQAGIYTESNFRYFVDQYGKEKAEQLIQFIVDYQISDLSGSNMGFDKNGNIKLIDYSSFNY